MFTEAPMASASMSGVTALFTSMDCTMSAGIRSNWTSRTSPSAEGTRSPFRVMEFRRGSVPRMRPKRASPWSMATANPGIRFIASPMLASGKRPIWSAATTLVMLDAIRCCWSARACPSRVPTTSTPASSMAWVVNWKDTETLDPDVTVTDWVASP